MTRGGKPVRGGIFGFLLGIFVALDLAIFNVLPLGLFTVVGLPLIGLAVGLVIGLTSPFGRRPEAAPPI